MSSHTCQNGRDQIVQTINAGEYVEKRAPSDTVGGNAKDCLNYATIALISHTSKVMLKILQGRLQQCVNCELPDVQVGFRKGRGARDQIANICWIIEKAREFQKKSTSALLTMPKPLTVWITINCGKF